MEGGKLQVAVDITSDVVCPWCWVGKRHIDSAMESLSGEFDFSVHWKPYLLNPDTPEDGVPLELYLRRKFGDSSLQRFFAEDSPLQQAGKAAGINFNPNRLVVPTRKAHMLLAVAESKGKQHELQECLFKAYFSEGQNIAEESVLRGLVEKVGMDGERAVAVLENQELLYNYERGITEAAMKGITGVPYFEIYLKDRPGMKQVLSGAQPIATFVALFKRLRSLPKM